MVCSSESPLSEVSLYFCQWLSEHDADTPCAENMLMFIFESMTPGESLLVIVYSDYTIGGDWENQNG